MTKFATMNWPLHGPWNSAGAVVADSEGRVLLSEPATEAQRFWQALEVE